MKRFMINGCVLFLISGSFAIAQNAPETPAKEVAVEEPINPALEGKLAEAARMQRDNKLEESELACIAILKEYPGNLDALYLLSSSLMKREAYKQAIPVLSALDKKGGSTPEVVNNLAWAYVSVKDESLRSGEKALPYAQAAVLNMPDSYQIWSSIAQAYALVGDYNKAKRAIKRSIGFAGNGIASDEDLAELSQQQADIAVLVKNHGAGTLYNETRTYDYWLNSGIRREKQGDALGASASFMMALLYDPQSKRARSGLGTSCISLKKEQRALEILIPLSKDYPNDFMVLNNISWIYATSSDLKVRSAEKALSYAKGALLLADRNYQVWSTLAEAYYLAGDYDKALRSAQTMAQLAQEQKASKAEMKLFQKLYIKYKRAADVMRLME